jgi:hypothetical protein
VDVSERGLWGGNHRYAFQHIAWGEPTVLMRELMKKPFF